jgi:hypothetical protein
MRPGYVQTRGVQLRAVEDDTFLIDPEIGTIHHLNQLGAAIWRQLDGPVSVPELIELLCAAFPEVPPARITADVESLLATLKAEGLVVTDPDGL